MEQSEQQLLSVFVLCPNEKILCLNHIDPREYSIFDLEAQIANKYQQSLRFDARKRCCRPDFMRDDGFCMEGVSTSKHLPQAENQEDFLEHQSNTGWTWLWKIMNNSGGRLILTYNGKVLRPDNFLEDYLCYGNNKCGSNHQRLDSSCQSLSLSPPITIHASHELQGGCFIISFTILLTIFGCIFMSVFTCGLSLFVIPFLCPLLFILPLFCL